MILGVPYEVRTLTAHPLGKLSADCTQRPALRAALVGQPAGRMDVPDDPNRLVRVRVARAPILHGGLLHLFSNMAFLRVFGNALAGVMNNLVYLVLYLVLGGYARWRFICL